MSDEPSGGTVKEPSDKRALPRPPRNRKQDKPAVPPNPEHQRLIEIWCDAYQAQFGSKYPFNGRDARAVKDLLAGTGKTAPEIVGIATKAWSSLSGFLLDRSHSLPGLWNSWAEIIPALSGTKKLNGLGDLSVYSSQQQARIEARDYSKPL